MKQLYIIKDADEISYLTHYKYAKLNFDGAEFLAKKSCKHCYGTGVIGTLLGKNNHKEKRSVYCNCLIQLKKEEEKKENGTTQNNSTTEDSRTDSI